MRRRVLARLNAPRSAKGKSRTTPAVRQDASTKTAIYNLRGGLGANQKPHGSSDGRYNAVFTAVVEKMKTSLTLIAKRDFGFVCRNDGFEHVGLRLPWLQVFSSLR